MENITIQKEPTIVTIHNRDIHQQVTDTIIEQLEAGTVPWHKPWSSDDNSLLTLPENYITGNKYQGINIVLLWCSSLKNNYQSNQWGSFKQWQMKKEFIRKGEKGSLIVYYDTIEREVDGEIQNIPFLKSSYVFNRCQLASYKATEKPHDPCADPLFEKIYPIEEFILNTHAIIEHREGGAYYIPLQDKIVMPFYECFETTAAYTATEGYYSTLLHELTHWTGNQQRLNRAEGKKFGDQYYATEELVAEFGAAFMCAGFGIASVDKGNHASYIDYWLKVLKENKKCLVTAASEASKACNYLNSLQPQKQKVG